MTLCARRLGVILFAVGIYAVLPDDPRRFDWPIFLKEQPTGQRFMFSKEPDGTLYVHSIVFNPTRNIPMIGECTIIFNEQDLRTVPIDILTNSLMTEGALHRHLIKEAEESNE